MHITGIIAEYNPLHTGHQYHIQQTKVDTNTDYIITVLSGNFVQRGMPAVIDKHTRTRMALEAGSDLVLELPVPYALASGEGFGFGGVSLLHQLGCVNALSFGTEAGNLEQIKTIAKLLIEETPQYQESYRQALRQGMTSPSARVYALKKAYPELNFSTLENHSNNMLALEYCKALYRLNSSIVPVTIKRKGQKYLATSIHENDHFASATAIRERLLEDAFAADLSDFLPLYVANSLQKSARNHALLFPDDFSNLLHYKLLLLTTDMLSNYWEITPHLANKIKKQLPYFETFTQFSNLLWTKDTTYARISRCLMHILLDMKEDTWDVHLPVPYARVLGFKKTSAPLLNQIKKTSDIPLVTKIADAHKNLSPSAYELLQTDIKSAHIYDSVLYHKSHIRLPHEAQKQIIILE